LTYQISADTDVKLSLDENLNKVLSKWESEKKKKKKEPAFYWRENEEKAKQVWFLELLSLIQRLGKTQYSCLFQGQLL
jgi:hypothetical protein